MTILCYVSPSNISVISIMCIFIKFYVVIILYKYTYTYDRLFFIRNTVNQKWHTWFLKWHCAHSACLNCMAGKLSSPAHPSSRAFRTFKVELTSLISKSNESPQRHLHTLNYQTRRHPTRRADKSIIFYFKEVLTIRSSERS